MSDATISQTRQAARRAIRELDEKFDTLLEQVLANPSGAGKQRLNQLKEYVRERNVLTDALFKLYDGDPPSQV